MAYFKNIKNSKSIMAADDDPFADMDFEEAEEVIETENTDSVEDSIDDVTDALDEINDALQDIEEDEVDIEINNNIEDHYIAECDRCHNIFITSIVYSDQEIEKISGICPVCDEESDQYLKWIIKDLAEVKDQEEGI